MHRRFIAFAAGLLFVLTGLAVATAPSKLHHLPAEPAITGSPADYIAAAESRIAASSRIIPGTEKRIRWFDGKEETKTEYVVVYFHGFSATRQEIAPVGEAVADALGANLFETRLAGHGLEDNALASVTAEDWLEDAVESLAIGATLGSKIVLIGTSTGATLALAVSDHELFRLVDTLVMISPNFAPRDDTAEMLIWPGGPQLARLMVGATRSWQAHNELQARYWSTSYPTEALVEMMRLVDRARSMLPRTLDQAVLTVYSPSDQVVNVDRIRSTLPLIGSPRAKTIELADSGDPSNHVLAGNILAPENNRLVTEQIVRFVTGTDL